MESNTQFKDAKAEAAWTSSRSPSYVGVVAAVAIVAVVSFILARKRRSQQLRERFGPEYDRVLKKEGEVRRAEGVLEIRAKRREKFAIRPLSEETRADFAGRWRIVQSHFVDDPRDSASQADETRGYPMTDLLGDAYPPRKEARA